VLVGSFAACALVLWVHPAHLLESAASIVVAAFFVALVSCLVEAVSHHGIDNFTLQIAASGVAWTLR
jgi:dolichol kinase